MITRSKYLVIIFLSLTVKVFSQKINSFEIAGSEKQTAQKKLNGETAHASNNFKVSYYRCEWKIDPAKYYIEGNVTPYFVITSSTNSITFDLTTQLHVDSILMRGTKLFFSQVADETLNIQLPSTYASGTKDSLTIFYQGIPAGGGFGSFVQTTHDGVPVIWTLSEPFGARDWWPCRNGLDDKADSIDVFVTHPSQYRASGNGILADIKTIGDNTVTHYKHRYPIASYLVAFAVTNYATFTDSVQLKNALLPVLSYVYPEDSAYFHSNTFMMLNAMRLYDSAFGEYPFEKERYGQTQFGFGGGMEHQTNSFVVSAGENLMAHELAHQWFGDKVTCATWTDIWLNEGFATYCADFLYSERYNLAQYKLNVQNDLADIVSQTNGTVKVNDTTSVSRIFNSRLSYHKGAFLLRMLRFTLGDEAFFNGIHNYITDPLLSYNFATTADLQRNLEAASGLDLDYFFQQWYSGAGYPSFKVQWSEDANNEATIKISQTTSDSSISFFKTPIELTFKNATQQKTIVLQNNVNDQIFSADIGFAADALLIDPNQYLISKNNTVVYSPIIITSDSIVVSPNPFSDRINISFQLVMDEKLLLQLFDDLGHLIAKQEVVATGGNQTYSLFVPSLAKGMYYLKIFSNNKTITRHLIKL